MTYLTTIVLILGLCLPQALLAGEVLEAGEIDRLKKTTDTLSVKKRTNPCELLASWRVAFLRGPLSALR